MKLDPIDTLLSIGLLVGIVVLAWDGLDVYDWVTIVLAVVVVLVMRHILRRLSNRS